MVKVVWQICCMRCSFDCLPCEWQSGTSDGPSYQSIPLGACVVVLCFEGEVDFCNKYMSSFLTNVSPWTYAHLSFYFASLYYYRATLADIEPFIYLPQNSHHTYLLWHFHSHSEIYCHATLHCSVHMTHTTFVILLFAWSCSWHRICGKATMHYFSYMSLLIHCTIPVHPGGIHIESYLVLALSCNSWVVNP